MKLVIHQRFRYYMWIADMMMIMRLLDQFSFRSTFRRTRPALRSFTLCTQRIVLYVLI